MYINHDNIASMRHLCRFLPVVLIAFVLTLCSLVGSGQSASAASLASGPAVDVSAAFLHGQSEFCSLIAVFLFASS